jgi:hypothetical protein
MHMVFLRRANAPVFGRAIGMRRPEMKLKIGWGNIKNVQ